jgi:6-O-methylguanine DNA methyltransferase, DNA binding domain
MSHKRKSWQEKLADSKGFPKVCKIDSTKSKRWGTGTFVIPAPKEVNELMSRVPEGRLTTIDEIRKSLARRHGTTIACPLTTGIFAWISAHAAAEAKAEGQKNTNPFWRTLKSKGELNPKYPGGIAELKRKLSAEGHRVIQKGKHFVVSEFQNRLAAIDDAPNGSRAAKSSLTREKRFPTSPD